MSIWSKLRGTPLMKTPRHVTPYRWSSGIGDYKSGQRVSFEQMRLAYEQNSVIRACVDTILAEAENAEWDIVPAEEDGEDVKRAAEEFAKDWGAENDVTDIELLREVAKIRHEKLKEDQENRIRALRKFFEQPNDDDDFVSFFHKVMHDVLVLDAGCVEKELGSNGKCAALWPVAGETVRVFSDEHGQILKYVQGEQVASPREFDEDAMIYIISNPRTSVPYGFSPLETLHREVATDLFQLGFTAKFFENNGIPPGILTMYGGSEQEFMRFLRQVEVQKAKNPSSVIVTNMNNEEGDMKYIPLRGQGKDDSDGYVDLSLWLVKRICSVYRVSPSQIGYVENGGGLNSSAPEKQKQIHNSKAVKPLLNLFERKMTAHVIHRSFNMYDLKFSFTYTDPENEEKEHERDSKDLEDGLVTINEIRKKRGMPPVDWGDVPYNPQQQMNWTEEKAFTAPQQPQPPMGGGGFPTEGEQ